MKPITIGVLSYQGTVIEHIKALSQLEGSLPWRSKLSLPCRRWTG